MHILPIAALDQYLFGITLFLLSSFLILLILVQQGRGGGLAGALGGAGGQSAFGTKAGDIFTRITIIAASIWIVLSAIAVYYFNEPDPGAALSNTTVNTTSSSSELTPGTGNGPGLSLTPIPPTMPTAPDGAAAEVNKSEEAPLTFEPTAPEAEATTAEPEAKSSNPPTEAVPTEAPGTKTPGTTEATTEAPSVAPPIEKPSSESTPTTQP